MEVDTEPSAPHRVEELWFEDGNLVIQVGNSQFHLYHGILAAHSPVFQDMLSFPQPSNSELVEGCPLVRIPDAEVEVSDFLKAIFLPEYATTVPIPHVIIVGCIRLGHKYKVDYLYCRALIHLSSGYRTSLAEWDSSSYNTDPKTSRPLSEIKSWPGTTVVAAITCVIQLAREVDALWILPTAFYQLSACFSVPHIGRHIGMEIFHGTVYNGVPTSLSVQDQQSFLHGHAIHARSAWRIRRFLSDPPSSALEGCTSATECALRRLQAIEIDPVSLLASSRPLNAWAGGDWDLLENVCPACLSVLRTTHADARQALWDKLPSMYGLPSWEELERMKVAAIGTPFL
ncbi:hypothetical protein B0H17DRAFT_1202107 [Mycena rosella]|uniref:BTB domain-containing protein n=1 Tax=Mycena rosella TaxID=1033263 RepID=A0AAD7DF81_MYCRO|nr:hypothetical protein B0H17DRAFT_1202107 [Mycena rosella]